MKIDKRLSAFYKVECVFLVCTTFVFLIAGCSSLNIFEAAHFGNNEKVKEFLDRGVPVDASKYRNQTPLNIALARKHLDTARLLIERGANVNNLDPTEDGTPPLTWAAKYGDVQLARMMFDHGAVPYVRDEFGMTPLMAAAANGHLEMAKFLLERGVNPQAMDRNGWTAFSYANSSKGAKTAGLLANIILPGYPKEVQSLNNSRWFPYGSPGNCAKPVIVPGSRTISIRGDVLYYGQEIQAGNSAFRFRVDLFIRSASKEKISTENGQESLEIILIDNDIIRTTSKNAKPREKGLIENKKKSLEISGGRIIDFDFETKATSNNGTTVEWHRCR